MDSSSQQQANGLKFKRRRRHKVLGQNLTEQKIRNLAKAAGLEPRLGESWPAFAKRVSDYTERYPQGDNDADNRD